MTGNDDESKSAGPGPLMSIIRWPVALIILALIVAYVLAKRYVLDAVGH